MTDHAQRAQELAEDCRVRDERSVTWITKALTQAHAAGRREGLEEVENRLSTIEAQVSPITMIGVEFTDDEMMAFKRVVGLVMQVVRARVTKAKEAGHE